MNTEFERLARQQAMNFLFVTFPNIMLHREKTKQLKYLLQPDTMSDTEWAAHIDVAWAPLLDGETN